MELMQNLSHLLSGTYLAYAAPNSTARAKLVSFAGGLVDPNMRRIFFKILRKSLANPANLFRRAHMQSVMIIQPINFEADGRQDMCDGCPDMTVHDGKLVWSCRLEELNDYGTFVETVSRAQVN